ncbi:hypothetical protein ACQBAU_10585 [Propionibacteriaceae bacterium Y2011]|uniref:hypothetical protein n=1 Tax=Microlunatus sp. Y2014 TaxID=3418488 RepID=UPI003B48A147
MTALQIDETDLRGIVPSRRRRAAGRGGRRRTATRRGPVLRVAGSRSTERPGGVCPPQLTGAGLGSASLTAEVLTPHRRAGHAPVSPVRTARAAGAARTRVAAAPAEWRLTDRGIAVVLSIGLVLVVAALVAVVGTAWTVTSADYQAIGQLVAG